MELESQGLIPIPPPRMRRGFDIDDLYEAKHQILWQLIKVNGSIILIFGISGYWLSGFTLRPIHEAMTEQNRFVADAAHELKTPLTALKTSLEVNLMNKKLSSETKSILNENLEDVIALQNLSEYLLLLTRSSQQQIKLLPVNLLPVIESAIRRIKPLANDKEIKIKNISFDQNLKVLGDEVLLTDLLLIILDNAIKYSAKGSEIEISVNEEKKSLFISISDQGIGISSADLPNIFKRFYRSDKARSRTDTSGHGLGLSVAQELIKQLRGEIIVRSQIGKGSTFTIRLNLY